MFNWDLYILDPFFIVLGIFFLALLFRREKEQKSHLIFYFETLLIWIANFILLKNFTNKLDNSATQFSSTVFIILAFFGSSTFFSIIFRPLATWITGLIHHRRVWMWASLVATLTGLIISHAFANTTPSAFLLVGLGILIAFSVSGQSLYYLYTNEQFYYRIFPVFSSIKIGSLIALASFIGSVAYSLNHTVQNQWFAEPNFNVHYLFGFCYLMVVGSLILSFLKKEDANYVRGFEAELVASFKKFNGKILLSLMLLALLWGLMYGLIQSKVLDFFFIARLKKENYSLGKVVSLFGLFEDAYLVPTFVFGYFFYNYVYKYFDTFQTTLLLTLVMAVVAAVAAFTRLWVIILIANFLFGIALSQMFYLLFGFAMMWNYRCQVPVTGLVASAALSGTFIVEIVVLILSTFRFGIFSEFTHVSQIVAADDVSAHIWMVDGSASLVFAALFLIVLLYALTSLIVFKKAAGESINMVTTINKMELVDRQLMYERLKSKLEL